VEELIQGYAAIDDSPVRCPDRDAEPKMMAFIQKAKEEGDTVGGVFVVVITGCPVGLGSHTQWDLKLDGQLAQAVMSINAVKGVEVGGGFPMARKLGSTVHDEIFYRAPHPNPRAHQPRPATAGGFYRKTNNAGGIEGGISNGEPLVIRAALKPLASLRKPLQSVHLVTKEPYRAEIIRSDVCPVAVAGTIGEAMAAFVVARAFRDKFGGDSLRELRENYTQYLEYLKNW
ncbi:MAG: chorismate synthase, partial [Elusimicrobia bacterium]|nr:chorismate synthase [Elusimicrobiota bacterium]